MVDPWLSFLILSVPLCSCSSRTRSSLCSQRRRPFTCCARSSCSCSFWRENAPGQTGERRTTMDSNSNAAYRIRGEDDDADSLSDRTAVRATAGALRLPLCEAGLVSAGWGWCSSSSPTTEGLASWAAPGRASAELVYTTASNKWCC